MRVTQLLLALFTFGVTALGAQQAPTTTRPAAAAAAQTAKPAALTAKPAGPALELAAPRETDSVRFAIIGDSGTGDRRQYEVGAQMTKAMQIFPFEFVIMLGDNIYGSERPQDFVKKFEKPYEGILTQKIPFYASLGNHDDPTQRFYKPFNMNGERFYSFKPSLLAPARFFALDSTYMTPAQVEWLNKELSSSGTDWKLALFHHPLYSSGDRHGSLLTLREQLEPTFLKYGMHVVFTGHDHFYERIRPQKGIAYFVVGNSAKLRRGDNSSQLTAQSYDEGYGFMLVEIEGDNFHFQAINQRGETIDKGVIRKDASTNKVSETGNGATKPPARR
jgi:3',5'-cyclic AMP phosphodiesterase CpdA